MKNIDSKTNKQKLFVSCFQTEFPGCKVLNRAMIKTVCEKHGLTWPSFIILNEDLKVGRGIFTVPVFDKKGNITIPKVTEADIDSIQPNKTTNPKVKPNKVKKVRQPKNIQPSIPSVYSIPSPEVSSEIIDEPIEMNIAPVLPEVKRQKISITELENDRSVSFIPPVDENFVQWGECSTLIKIFKSDMFFPTFITGLSGNGKTFMVQQVGAICKKEVIRVNITIETDEDDLIGGFRLINGETVWHNGPVVEAMLRGAILLLDEIDLASNKIMCLQPILEGNGIYIKKTGRFIRPASGFNIVATANTKGKGSESGRFIGTNILNEAFLERFCITMEQEYPDTSKEIEILSKTITSIVNRDLKVDENEFIENLVTWANTIRDSFKQNIVDEIITTRRLIHILKMFTFLKNRKKSITYGVSRFDEEIKTTFIDLYSKIDKMFGEVEEENININTEVEKTEDPSILTSQIPW